MLGVFAKVVLGQSVKTRLQSRFTRQEAEHFHVACLADTLETGMGLEVPVTLFLQGGEAPRAVQDLATRLVSIGFAPPLWQRLAIQTQAGADLGERLERAFAHLCAPGTHGSCLIVGSDHPTVPASALREGFERLRGRDRGVSPRRDGAEEGPDLVLGPTEDGGYWSIGCARPIPGLLRHIAWSTPSVLQQTRQRAEQRGLRVELLQPWTDVDRPEDVSVLVRQITARRAAGDRSTGRFVEALLQQLGWMRR